MMWENIVRNWKTSGSAVIAAVAGLVAVFYPGETQTINQVAAAVALLFGALLGLASKDSDRSGTADNPRS